MEAADQELIAEFVVESQEGLANIENQMLSIEAAGGNVNVDLVNSVFRTMHSIKGAAGFLGLDRIGLLAHSLEEVLNHLRNREMIPTSELVTDMLSAADFMKSLLDEVESSNSADVTPYINSLHKFRLGNKGESKNTKPETPVNDTTTETALPTDEDPNTSPLMKEALREFLVECYENLDQMERDLFALEAEPNNEKLLRSLFRTMHTIKGGAGLLSFGKLELLAHETESVLSQLRNGQWSFTPVLSACLLAAMDKCREGLQLIESTNRDLGFDAQEVVAQLRQLAQPTSAAQPAVAQPIDTKSSEVKSEAKYEEVPPVTAPHVPPTVAPASMAPPAPIAPAAPVVSQQDSSATEGTGEKAYSAADATIRVDVALLDKLMTRVGELVLARNQILQYTSGLDDINYVNAAQRLNLITTELQQDVMTTRMQPIGNVWAKFPRVVRDLAAQLGKQVRIEMEGKETELDKTIMEAIKDPLTHIVRNSVDHGIELPSKRLEAGKAVEGTILLRAFHEGGQVIIEISDDGGGLNVDRIRKKAIERGIVTAEQAARTSDRDALQWIFQPGFSTAEQVTSVSGRGVGMDVVKTNIERLGGTIDLQNRPGQGSTVKIKIPLTLAIIPALIVGNGGERYAIPQVNLLELVRLDDTKADQGIEFVHGAPVYRLRGKLLPLLNLSEQLGVPAAPSTSNATRVLNIVVLRANDCQFGLIVDRVNDSEEIVVKPLSRQLKHLRSYAGATIMGDGAVALILDVLGLAINAGLIGESRNGNGSSNTCGETEGELQTETLLVVDLGDARRFALPTSMISRLEKVPRASIEHANGQEVIQHRGGILPLVRLRNLFETTLETQPEGSELQIVVHTEQGKACGFVVHRILDIVEADRALCAASSGREMLLGTTVIQQHVTDIVNLRHLARQATHAFAVNRSHA